MAVARTASPRVTDVAPILQLPPFRALLTDEEDKHLDIDNGSATSDEHTKKSFDFTGEIKNSTSQVVLSAGHLSNILQSKADLRYDFNGHLRVEVSPVPSVPVDLRMAVDADSSIGTSTIETVDLSATQSQLLDMRRSSMIEMSQEGALTQENMTRSRFDIFSLSRIVDMKEPSLLQDRIVSVNNSPETHDILFRADGNFSSAELARSIASKPSDGQLNTSFKFNGPPKHGSTAFWSQD